MWYKKGGGKDGEISGQFFGAYILYFIQPNFLFSSSASFCDCSKDESNRRYIYFTSSVLLIQVYLKIRQISTPYRCGLTTLEALTKMATIFFILLKIRNWRKTVVIEQIVIIKHCCFLLTFCVFLLKKMKNAFLFTNQLTIWYL